MNKGVNEMELNYMALRQLAEEKASHNAKLLYPPGYKQEKIRRELADKYYSEYTRRNGLAEKGRMKCTVK